MDETEPGADFGESLENDFVLIGPDGEELTEPSGKTEGIDRNCGQLCRTLNEIGISCPGHSKETPFSVVPTISDKIQYSNHSPSSLSSRDYSNVEDLLITLKIKIAAMKKEAQANDEIIARQVSLLELQTQVLRDLHTFRISK